jgi:protein-L-isoaspartate(D-aspartate) O-methyltransferase
MLRLDRYARAALTVLLVCAWCPTQGALARDPDFSRQRDEMVEHQIASRGIETQAVLDAMRNVPRHEFVPADYRRRSYEDGPLPIGYGQTISQPYIVAAMTELVRPEPEMRVLEIGTGSGYQAAVLSGLVGEVYSVEIIKGLLDSARDRLAALGYENVSVKHADGYHGWPEHAPFDAIIVTAAAEFIPPPLLEQLGDGGRMVIPVGSPFFVQRLMLVEKQDGKITSRSVMPVRFVPLTRE